MSNLILSADDDIAKIHDLCKSYNQNIINNSYSETNVGDIYYTFILFHQYLKDIHSFKAIHNKYKHIRSLPSQLYQIILDIVCEENLSKFTLHYNALYNNLQLLT